MCQRQLVVFLNLLDNRLIRDGWNVWKFAIDPYSLPVKFKPASYARINLICLTDNNIVASAVLLFAKNVQIFGLESLSTDTNKEFVHVKTVWSRFISVSISWQPIKTQILTIQQTKTKRIVNNKTQQSHPNNFSLF